MNERGGVALRALSELLVLPWVTMMMVQKQLHWLIRSNLEQILCSYGVGWVKIRKKLSCLQISSGASGYNSSCWCLQTGNHNNSTQRLSSCKELLVEAYVWIYVSVFVCLFVCVLYSVFCWVTCKHFMSCLHLLELHWWC